MNAEDKLNQALNGALRNWESMSGSDSDEAESTADEFEASFYNFIDALREWVYGLDSRPVTMEEFSALPLVQTILERLPAPLYLNFETEAELILENKSRVEDDKYD
ncbi:hypothetical protein [Paenibacillus sp. sptzw28]|uniref:hypothetical protein n=1 Tax=Paenibacillus sp. sptzw28 TaxID=715179 RepID=UPI002162945B|nr:hypothetical protein [Paenibacillus sp. sptzw28]